MTTTGMFLRRQDGLVKVCPNVKVVSSGVYEKQGTPYRCKYTLPSYNGDRHELLVCEQDVDNITSLEPFVRFLPGILGHELFFGDLLLVHRDGDGHPTPMTLDEMRSFFEGTHERWCMRSIRDIGQKEELFVEEEDDDDDDEEDDETQTHVTEEEEDIILDENSDDEDPSDDDIDI